MQFWLGAKSSLLLGQDSNPQRDKCDSMMVEKKQGEIKRRNETNEGEKKNVEKKNAEMW